ncbi:MAG: hypothetical protein JETT_2653 [Candidatus Jettenia ecosi]|uniref:Uncharacterized protein n=1 Tax=Candidatus Jettenia ecosi TaxID=2494326 RepID=A0A533Q8X8_9BACT|nr:MAG: hypothetical protein JETT_2653 [Candidatus Jettenia ecosi]
MNKGKRMGIMKFTAMSCLLAFAVIIGINIILKNSVLHYL